MKFFILLCSTFFLSISLLSSFAYAEIIAANLIKAENGEQITIFRQAGQKPDQMTLLIEGTGTSWDKKPIDVLVKDLGAGGFDYSIDWKGRKYIILASRYGSYDLSIPAPFKEIHGFRKPYSEEPKIDLERLQNLVDTNKNEK